jgi:hypothetical protein
VVARNGVFQNDTFSRQSSMYRSSSSSDKPVATLSKAEMKWARQMEGRVTNLKRRIATMNHLIAECDRLAADLDREIRIEEDRVKIHNPAYSTYAQAHRDQFLIRT